MREFFNAHFGSTGTGARLLPMEGLRGVAALLVFFVHFDCLFRPYLREGSLVGTLADVAGNFGHTGVDLFFVLSGFLIYGILIKKHVDYGDFLWRRVKRLYPVFLVVLGLYLVLSVLYPSYSKLPHSWPHALMLVGANLLMLPGVTNIPAIITVSWSLSYEWLFYLTVPLLIVVLGLRRWNPRHRVMFFRLLIIGKYALWSFGLSEHIRAILFCAGIILWELVHQGISRFLPSWAEYIVAIAFAVNLLAIGLIGATHGEAILVLSHVPQFFIPSLFISLPLFILYATFFNGFLSRVFSLDYLRWMGNISYSYYLIHGLALQGMKLVVNHFFSPTGRSAFFDLLLLAACVSFTVLCGAVVFIFVEKPLSWHVPRRIAIAGASSSDGQMAGADATVVANQRLPKSA